MSTFTSFKNLLVESIKQRNYENIISVDIGSTVITVVINQTNQKHDICKIQASQLYDTFNLDDHMDLRENIKSTLWLSQCGFEAVNNVSRSWIQNLSLYLSRAYHGYSNIVDYSTCKCTPLTNEERVFRLLTHYQKCTCTIGYGAPELHDEGIYTS